jgi:hypothetical protein
MRPKSLNEPINIISSDENLSETDGEPEKGLPAPFDLGDLCQNIYSKTCKCKRDSASCLCGIIPGPGGYRKKGLWQRDSQALVVQGFNPADNAREVSPDPSPACLTCMQQYLIEDCDNFKNNC